MLINLVKKNIIYKFILPKTIQGSFWITDLDETGQRRNLVNIEAQNGEWILRSNYEANIATNTGNIQNALVKENNFYFIKVKNEPSYSVLFSSPVYDNSFKIYNIEGDNEIKIGSGNGNDIVYKNGCIDVNHCKIYKLNERYVIEDNKSKFGVYVDSKRIMGVSYLEFGNVIFVMGLRIVFMGNKLIINNYNNTLYTNPKKLVLDTESDLTEEVDILDMDDVDSDDNIVEFYKEEDYFYKSPRFIASVEKNTFVIDAPPQKVKEDDTPLFYTMGPMVTMGMSSMVTITSTLNSAYSTGTSISSVMPTLIVAGAMLASMIIWPTLTRNYQKRKAKSNEKQRQEKYKNYLETKRQEINTFSEKQKASMFEQSITLEEHQSIILEKKRKLWERKWEHEDFLSVRLGIGSAPLNAEINYPVDGFTMEEDNLRKSVQDLGDSVKTLYDVPVNLSLLKRNNLVATGTKELRCQFINNTILQLMSEHSYEDLKLVFLLEDVDFDFDVYKSLPHCWDNQKKIRFFADNFEEMNEVSFYLENIFNIRENPNDNEYQGEKKIEKHLPYYMLITNDIKKARKLEIVDKILESKVNLGFGIIILNETLSNLPDECSNFVFLEDKKCALVENDLNANNQSHFFLDKANINTRLCVEKLANIPIKFESVEGSVPETIDFLEMYNVGKIEQLNAFDRWQTTNPSKSLSVPIGLYRENELFKLDLHEKYHGPHGLIAGTTGSGKSEFIITYILSMAINFSPEEVSFVLIDYKGGGLAYAFENKELGLKLPHLAGTITNLDSIEINRSLSSIESELKRRQTLFNEAKTKLGESTMDIYKYQNYYREGKLTEPVTHLFIISDEFAELKQQQPDFMDQLISTARIGRSLGVHLILATQKPSGVVNDQIWSNSRFKVCLKVQEKSDSMDVIKRDDAASLKNPGRFYLQVGYNELFALGQAAWAGAQYYPTEKLIKKFDRSVTFVDNLGNIVKSVSDEHSVVKKSMGEEGTNILKYIIDIAKKHDMFARTLWLPRIPAIIFVDELKKKYNYKLTNRINPIIGEYDDPNHQRQDLLTIDFTDKGNTLIYGSAGMGKENALVTLIYSLISTFTPQDINIYILDFGAEIFKMFSNAPHVGDVIFAEDTEKIKNLFRTLGAEIDRRKVEFANYNGDLNLYNKNSGKEVPRLIVILNNYEGFSEQCDEYSDILSYLTREGEKYGIMFVMTVTNSNGVRSRLQQNFTNLLPLQFNNPEDYYNVIGNTKKMVPSKYKGRGLLKSGTSILEYQMALPCLEESITEFIMNISKELLAKYKIKAPGIKVLPNVVTVDMLKPYLKGLANVPIGIDRDKLTVTFYNFEKNFGTIVSSQDQEISNNFVSALASIMSNIDNNNVIVFDAESVVEEINNVKIYTEGFIPVMDELIKSNVNSTLVIVGYDKFIKQIKGDLETFTNLMDVNNQNKNVRIIISDTANKLKNHIYESYFKNFFNTNNGIWIGDGVQEQTLLSLSGYNRELRKEVGSAFGFVIIQSKCVSIIKYINILK